MFCIAEHSRIVVVFCVLSFGLLFRGDTELRLVTLFIERLIACFDIHCMYKLVKVTHKFMQVVVLFTFRLRSAVSHCDYFDISLCQLVFMVYPNASHAALS